MASGPITSWDMDGEREETVETVSDFILGGSKITADGDCSHEIKRCLLFGRNDAEAETPVLWLPHAKSWLIGKDSDTGRDWGQEEKGTTEDEMAGWHHRLNGRKFEWALGVGDEQGGLTGCDSWGHKESDMTERLNWTELNDFIGEGNGNLLQFFFFFPWGIPGMQEPGGLPTMGSHRVRHGWSDLAAAAAAMISWCYCEVLMSKFAENNLHRV